jgi:hypothetical protein
MSAFRVWTEFLVRVRVRVSVRVRVRVWVTVTVRVRVAVRAAVAFRVWMQCTVPTGKRQCTPERNGIGHTHARASSGGAKA